MKGDLATSVLSLLGEKEGGGTEATLPLLPTLLALPRPLHPYQILSPLQGTDGAGACQAAAAGARAASALGAVLTQTGSTCCCHGQFSCFGLGHSRFCPKALDAQGGYPKAGLCPKRQGAQGGSEPDAATHHHNTLTPKPCTSPLPSCSSPTAHIGPLEQPHPKE